MPIFDTTPSGGSTSGVTSFNSRTGAVTPQTGDYTAANQITHPELKQEKIAKPVLLVGCVYYMLIPFISTFLADIADHNPKLDIPHKGRKNLKREV